LPSNNHIDISFPGTHEVHISSFVPPKLVNRVEQWSHKENHSGFFTTTAPVPYVGDHVIHAHGELALISFPNELKCFLNEKLRIKL
jgi:hypothetical protein